MKFAKKRSIGPHHHLRANTARAPGPHPRHLPLLDPQTALDATVAAFGLHELPLVDQYGLNRALPAPSGAPTLALAAAGMNRGVTVRYDFLPRPRPPPLHRCLESAILSD